MCLSIAVTFNFILACSSPLDQRPVHRLILFIFINNQLHKEALEVGSTFMTLQEKFCRQTYWRPGSQHVFYILLICCHIQSMNSKIASMWGPQWNRQESHNIGSPFVAKRYNSKDKKERLLLSTIINNFHSLIVQTFTISRGQKAWCRNATRLRTVPWSPKICFLPNWAAFVYIWRPGISSSHTPASSISEWNPDSPNAAV